MKMAPFLDGSGKVLHVCSMHTPPIMLSQVSREKKNIYLRIYTFKTHIYICIYALYALYIYCIYCIYTYIYILYIDMVLHRNELYNPQVCLYFVETMQGDHLQLHQLGGCQQGLAALYQGDHCDREWWNPCCCWFMLSILFASSPN